ncbi:inositol polyphosphate kinase-domain-containing protein [Geopyxis carbonaria]|nr:inositol polyphosphate kinase-domain-containing protein [Geopyxis carbonaria]
MPAPKKLKASDLKAFDLAAAGHDGVLSDASGALVVKPCTAREVAFYESVAAHPAFAEWMPTFMGTLQLHADVDAATASAGAGGKAHDRDSSIVMQNLAHGFVHASVLDVKLGAQLWDDAAPLEKRARLDAVADATTSRSLGFRVAGIKVWKGAEEGYKVHDKNYGRTFTADNVIEAIREYFTGELSAEQVKMLAGRWKAKVDEVAAVLENEESRMYSASLLFVYEGDKAALEAALEEERTRVPKTQEELEDEDDDDEEVVKPVEMVKLIDFAHASWTPGQGPDENALQGVRSMSKLLGEIAGA